MWPPADIGPIVGGWRHTRNMSCSRRDVVTWVRAYAADGRPHLAHQLVHTAPWGWLITAGFDRAVDDTILGEGPLTVDRRDGSIWGCGSLGAFTLGDVHSESDYERWRAAEAWPVGSVFEVSTVQGRPAPAA